MGHFTFLQPLSGLDTDDIVITFGSLAGESPRRGSAAFEVPISQSNRIEGPISGGHRPRQRPEPYVDTPGSSKESENEAKSCVRVKYENKRVDGRVKTVRHLNKDTLSLTEEMVTQLRSKKESPLFSEQIANTTQNISRKARHRIKIASSSMIDQTV